MQFKYIILNFIQIYDFKFHKKYLKILIILTSIFSLVNKSLMISMFSFSTAAYNAVLWIIFQNFIQIYDLKCNSNLWF